MGKQIQVAALYPDELLFLGFLRSKYDVAILKSFAPTKEALWVETFDENPIGNWMYYIWNRNFNWKPEYAQTKSKDSWYISNKNDSPVIEFSRSDPNKLATGEHGRLYWSKYFSAVGELGYDVDTFSKWYDTLVRWVKKNQCRQKRRDKHLLSSRSLANVPIEQLNPSVVKPANSLSTFPVKLVAAQC